MTSGTGTDDAAAPPQPSTQPPMRASDADRYATVRVLQDAVAHGLLTPDEGSERMAAAFAAVRLLDLGPLTADLPAASPDGRAAWQARARQAVAHVRSFLTGDGGRLQPARVVVALLIVVLLLAVVGSLAAELFVDGGGGPGRGGPGRGGPGRG